MILSSGTILYELLNILVIALNHVIYTLKNKLSCMLNSTYHLSAYQFEYDMDCVSKEPLSSSLLYPQKVWFK